MRLFAAVGLGLFLVPLALASDFGRPAEIPLGKQPAALAVGDATQDGIPDVVTANSSSPGVSILRGLGNGSFERSRDYSAAAVGIGARFVEFGDFDGDGASELAVAAGDRIAIVVATDGALVRQGTYAVQAPAFLATGDLNADGNLDLLATSSTRAAVSVLLGRGDKAFDPPAEYGIAGPARSVAVADLNDDEVPDVAATGSSVSLLYGLGDGSFEPFRTLVGPVAALRSIDAEDVDEDGDADLVVAGGQNQVALLVNSGDGTFLWDAYRVGGTPSWVSLADLDGDGVLDVITANRGSNDISVLHGAESGRLGPETRTRVGRAPTALGAEDLDGDGETDLAVLNQASKSVTVLLNGADAPLPVVCLVPRVARKTLGVAQRMIRQAHCTLAPVHRKYSNRVKRRRVIAQSPVPGTRLPEGARVTLLVSRGPRR